MKRIICFVACGMFLLACTKEEVNNELNLPETVIEYTDVYEFIYNDSFYSSPYYLNEDEEMIFEDEKVSKLINELREKELSTLIENGQPDRLFDTSKDLEEFLCVGTNGTRATQLLDLTTYSVALYEHKDFGGYKMSYTNTKGPNPKEFGLTNITWTYVYIPPMYGQSTYADMDNKVTSVFVTGPRDRRTSLILYRGANYTSNSIAIRYSYTTPYQVTNTTVANLTSKSFNDKTSSFKIVQD